MSSYLPPQAPGSWRPDLPEDEEPQNGAVTPASADDRGDGDPDWRWWMAPAALLAALFATTLVGAVVIGVVEAAGGDGTGGAANVSLTFIQDVMFVGAALWIASLAGRPRPESFGLQATPFWSAVGWVAAAAVAYVIFTAAWAPLAEGESQENLFESLNVGKSALEVGALALLVCVMAPITEEFLFRGFMWSAFRTALGAVGAALAVGLIFGGIHLPSTPWVLLVPLGVLGFLLCLLRWKTKSLYPPIALHTLNNCVAFAYLQGWDWQTLPLIAGAGAVVAGILALVPSRPRPA